MDYLRIAEVLFFTAYILFIVYKFGIRPSISDSWYDLGQQYGWIFTMFFCFAVGLLHALQAPNALIFLSGGFLCFVGVATDFKRAETLRGNPKINPIMHVIGATGSILLSVIGYAMEGIYWTAAPIILGYWLLRDDPNRTWWVEIIAFVSVITSAFLVT